MKTISNTEYQELRNKIWSDLVSCGVVSDEDEDYSAFDDVLGSHLKVNWDDNNDNILDRLDPYISYDDPQEVIDTWKSLTQEQIENDLVDDHFTLIESLEYSSIALRDI